MKPDAPSSPLSGHVRALTAMTAQDDALPVYEAWAPDYESDLIEQYGYCAHEVAADALANACRKPDIDILDLGCGTGLVGESLVARGFRTIDGFDASEGMLEQARAKGIYRRLIHGDIREPGVLPNGHYGAAIAVGVFGGGHVGPEHLGAFMQPVAAGGAIVLYANGIPFDEDDYLGHLERLSAEGLCRIERVEQTNYMDKIERPGYLVVATRTLDAEP